MITPYFKNSIKISQSLYSFNIIFCWLPSHVGIPDNEKADKVVKSALNKLILLIPIPYTDLKPIINKYIHDKWQQTWNSQTQNKLYQIYPTKPSPLFLFHINERTKSYINDYALDILIQHILLLLNKVLLCKCTNCNQLLSVKHILTECT